MASCRLFVRKLHSGARVSSARAWWSKVPMGPKDPILGVTEAFKADTSPTKLNLGVGAYRDDNGKPTILKSVQVAQQMIMDNKMDNEYAPIAGSPEFTQVATELAYGSNNHLLKEGMVASIQSLSGTGALRLLGEFLYKFYTPATHLYLPNPTWGNHIPIFADSHHDLKRYRYYNPKTMGLDLTGLLEDVANAPNESIFLLHACAHNPTGVDPKPEEWKKISQELKRKHHFVILDMAYQGFASGDVNKDALALQQLVSDGHRIAVCQSFAKNFGLYGQRVGCLSLVTDSAEESKRVESQLKIIARPIYSNPPIHGARLVTNILKDKSLKAQWLLDVKEMAERIIKMREMLFLELKKLGSKHNWDHIKNQIGMFCYSGMTPEQVDNIIREHHVYLTKDGRISMAGVTSKNVGYLANAIHQVTK